MCAGGVGDSGAEAMVVWAVVLLNVQMAARFVGWIPTCLAFDFPQNLRDINCMIKQGERLSRKRAFTMESDSESPTKYLCQENDDILLKRLQDVVSERANR